jgi:hypothetical protein
MTNHKEDTMDKIDPNQIEDFGTTTGTAVIGTVPRAEPVLEQDDGIPGPDVPQPTPSKRDDVKEPAPQPVLPAGAPGDEEFIGGEDDKPQQRTESPEEFVETFQPRYEAAEITITDHRDPRKSSRTYVQRPLSFIAKADLYRVLGTAVEKAAEGQDMRSLLSSMGLAVGAGPGATMDELGELPVLLQAGAKLVQYSPELFQEIFVIALDVPMDERVWAKAVIRRSPDEGGWDDDQAIEVIERFMDQNFETIREFFMGKLRALAARARARTQSSAGRRSKR